MEQARNTRTWQSRIDKGYAILTLPCEVTPEDVADCKAWFKLILRTLTREVERKQEPVTTPGDHQ